MKKRIKLTDKELAIGMWVYICLYIESYAVNFEKPKAIVSLKRRWLEEHDRESYTNFVAPYWMHDCWLCDKYWEHGCMHCPLGKCGRGSLYDKVIKFYHSKNKQIKALECSKKILNVILAEKGAEDEDN